MIGLDHTCLFQATPEDVYRALTQRVPEWWSSDFEGRATHLGEALVAFSVYLGAKQVSLERRWRKIRHDFCNEVWTADDAEPR